MTAEVLSFAAQSMQQGRAVALITVTGTHGSSPASPGQMMAILGDGSSVGTVGGGASEHRLVLRAVEAIQNGEPSFTFTFDHSEDGMVCGGGMSGIGVVSGAGPQLLVFGGGHVSQQLVPLAVSAGFSATVVEDRPDLESAFPNSRYLLASPAEYGQKLHIGPNTYVVICTRGHATDDEALRFSLDKGAAYLGMIGSKKKVSTLFEALEKDGVDKSLLMKVYAPIGLDIASGIPAEIAVSIVAELLLVKNNGSPRHKKLRV